MDSIISGLSNLTLQQDDKSVKFVEGRLCCQIISANEGDEKDFENLRDINPQKYHFFFGNLCNISCLHSHVDCLNYAIQRGFPFCKKALLYCAQSGSELCFIQCLHRGLEYVPDVYLWAVDYGQIKFLDFLIHNNFPPHPYSLKRAFECKRIDIMNMLFYTGQFFIDEEIIDMAINCDDQDFKLFVCYNLDSRFLSIDSCSKAEKLSLQIHI
jgi:hypothetical protein